MALTLSVVLLTACASALLIVTGYLVALTIAAVAGKRAALPDGPGVRHFAILVPAHNEEFVLSRLIESLQRLDYPRNLVEIIVVADNSDDETASLARSRGARVYERFDEVFQGKGHALRWLLQQLSDEGRRYDAYVIVDADSVVAEDFLRRMDARLEAGSQAVQAYYSVLNPSESHLSALRFAALAAIHYLRPLGRSALGLSCGLKGNGMCFSATILDRFSWRWFTLAEDVEFHLALVRAGVRVDFAPETWVQADMPTTFAQARSQNERWERGRLHLLRRRVPELLRSGASRWNLVQLDAAVDQFIPPLSVPFALAGLCLLLSVALGGTTPAILAGLSLAGQTLYLLCGLALVRAPLKMYGALAYAPLYVAWKLGLYSRAVVSTNSMRWIRTARAAIPIVDAPAEIHSMKLPHATPVHTGTSVPTESG